MVAMVMLGRMTPHRADILRLEQQTEGLLHRIVGGA